jgi:hypothetical protein
MTPDERRHGTSKSGWCLRLGRPDCAHCERPECPCDCHQTKRTVQTTGEGGE